MGQKLTVSCNQHRGMEWVVSMGRAGWLASYLYQVDYILIQVVDAMEGWPLVEWDVII